MKLAILHDPQALEELVVRKTGRAYDEVGLKSSSFWKLVKYRMMLAILHDSHALKELVVGFFQGV